MSKKPLPDDLIEMQKLLKEFDRAVPIYGAEAECHQLRKARFRERLNAAQEKVAAGTHHLQVSYEVKYLCEDGSPWRGDLNDLRIEEVKDENGERIIVQFSVRKIAKARRPLCGAPCTDGHLCKKGVVIRTDGMGVSSFARRCYVHGGLSNE